jgi:putative ABC transport system ATP-binding protein
MLNINDVSKAFKQGNKLIKVLENTNLSVRKGERISILGQSGSGKSTLLTLLAGLDHPDSGSVVVNNQNLELLNQNELSSFRAKHIGIIFQQYHLMRHLTAVENVSIPLELQRLDNALEKSKNALKSVGLSNRMSHCPAQLSGGECQRVAIARAIVPEPSIILADEPSGNLDQKTGKEIMDLIFQLCEERNQTLILVTHNNELANECHRTLHLSEGKLIERE